MEVKQTSKYQKDVKRLKKQGKDLEILDEVLRPLMAGEPLGQKYQDHPLHGKYSDARECHIRPDWLLIYERTVDTLILRRMGSHAELFE